MIIRKLTHLPDLQLPGVIQALNLSDRRVRLLIGPLKRGMAITLGAALHETLMRPSPGCLTTRSAPAQHPLDKARAVARAASYQVENSGVARGSELERLILEVQTDASISPLEAVQMGAALLTESCRGIEPGKATCPFELHAEQQAVHDWDHARAGLTRTVEELGLGLRTCNCLRFEKINLVGDLIQRTETELLRMPHLGRRGCQEIRHALASRGLMLGTPLQGWRPS